MCTCRIHLCVCIYVPWHQLLLVIMLFAQKRCCANKLFLRGAHPTMSQAYCFGRTCLCRNQLSTVYTAHYVWLKRYISILSNKHVYTSIGQKYMTQTPTVCTYIHTCIQLQQWHFKVQVYTCTYAHQYPYYLKNTSRFLLLPTVLQCFSYSLSCEDYSIHGYRENV